LDVTSVDALTEGGENPTTENLDKIEQYQEGVKKKRAGTKRYHSRGEAGSAGEAGIELNEPLGLQ